MVFFQFENLGLPKLLESRIKTLIYSILNSGILIFHIIFLLRLLILSPTLIAICLFSINTYFCKISVSPSNAVGGSLLFKFT